MEYDLQCCCGLDQEAQRPVSGLTLTKPVNTIHTLILGNIVVTIGGVITLSLVAERVSSSVAGIYAGTTLAFIGATAYIVMLRMIVSAWKNRNP